MIRSVAGGVLPLTGSAAAAERMRVPSLAFTVAREECEFSIARADHLHRHPRGRLMSYEFTVPIKDPVAVLAPGMD